MVVDLHCHILDGIDDGPKTLEESVSLCRKLEEKGIGKVVATPHFIGDYDNKPTPKLIADKISTLESEIRKEGIKLEIYPGMEVFASHDTVERIKQGEILSLNNSRYILIEFSFENIPRYMADLLFSIQLEGYIPIIAHPERYNPQYMKSGLLSEVVDKGALLQVNSGSVMGVHGKSVRKEAIKLIRDGMVHLVGSDSHGGRRPVYAVEEVEKTLAGICGAGNAQKMVYTNPVRVFEDKEVEMISDIKKRSFIVEMFRNIGFDM